MFATESQFSAGTGWSFSCAVVMTAALAPPSSMLLTVWLGWNLWTAKKEEETEEQSDLESNGDSDPESDPSCMGAPAESSSKVERATGTENERASM